MESVIINRRDLEFQIFEVFKATELCSRERFVDHDEESLKAALDVTIKIAEEVLWPNAPIGDTEEPHLKNGQVYVPQAVHRGVAAIRDAGFIAAGLDYDRGGMQLPAILLQACLGIFKAADAATPGYLMLTKAAANLLDVHGTEEQKRLYMKPMYEGRFLGTMCLSEPDVGSSLADIKCRAEPQPNGNYLLSGNKMWISGGDQDISDNIIHLVLAKLPDAPPGVKGISLFLVPKICVNPDGSLGKANDVSVAGLNHKMGYRAISNCLLNFGEKNFCEGYLIGEKHGGLACMFHMMNEARIAVGISGAMIGYTAYMQALNYAKDRKQGRPIDNRNPEHSPVPIIDHADVRRMLLKQKSFVEGALALCLMCAKYLDESETATEKNTKYRAGLLLEILTPIAKTWPAEFCQESISLAIQVHGGYGYTKDFSVERLYRDNRLNAIHEGTSGIQAIDLLGRKVRIEEGLGFNFLMEDITSDIEYASSWPELKTFTTTLMEYLSDIVKATKNINDARDDGRKADSLANASLYLHALGHIVVSWLWLKQSVVAFEQITKSPDTQDADFYKGKISACKYFFLYELPQIKPLIHLLSNIDTTCREHEPKMF
jgi:alkylation response protein AidB-like acyl-CoA dehydrogenase|tara:strand:- start:278 stop:2083 length:1806 start_codon:yes stop_codon:yes gene_type:complete